jgi:hypothetical protein
MPEDAIFAPSTFPTVPGFATMVLVNVAASDRPGSGSPPATTLAVRLA